MPIEASFIPGSTTSALNPLMSAKAFDPIDERVFGRNIWVHCSHPLNTLSAIDVVP